MRYFSVLFAALCLTACAADAEPVPDAEPLGVVSAPLRQDPLKCYAACIDRGGSPGNCDTSCQCNGQCE